MTKSKQKKFVFSNVSDKILEVFDQIEEKVQQTRKSEVEILIEKNLNKINDLCTNGVSISKIYETLNKSFCLGVSKSHFLTLVRRERKRVESPLYAPRKPYKNSKVKTYSI